MSEKKPQLFKIEGGKVTWVSGDTTPDPQELLHRRQLEQSKGFGDPAWKPNDRYTLTPDRGRGNPWEDKKKVA